MRFSFLVMVLVLRMVSAPLFAAEPTATPSPTKPPLTLAKDGFPMSNDTPEGVACEFARACIRNDGALLLATCIEPFGGEEVRKAYHKFLESLVVQAKFDAARTEPAPNDLKSLTKCFAARPLSKDGPASYGYAAFGFQEVMFVDVVCSQQNGETPICRTLVIKTKAGKWAVYPQPEQTPLLSAGLDDEAPSTRDFSEAYPVK